MIDYMDSSRGVGNFFNDVVESDCIGDSVESDCKDKPDVNVLKW